MTNGRDLLSTGTLPDCSLGAIQNLLTELSLHETRARSFPHLAVKKSALFCVFTAPWRISQPDSKGLDAKVDGSQYASVAEIYCLREPPLKSVRTVERALRILFCVAQSEQPAGLTELSARVGLDKATTLRLLTTLEQAELVRRDPRTRCFIPGPAIWRLAYSWRNDLRQASRPVLEALGHKTGESVSLLTSRGLERVVIDVVPAKHELSVVPTIGSAHPIYAGASGKVFMAFMSDDERERVIKITGLKPLTPAGISDPGRFREVLATVRRQGFAYSVGDVTMGACAVAAPIFGSSGQIAGVVSVRGPEVRMPQDRIASIAKVVVQAAADVSWRIGFDRERQASA